MEETQESTKKSLAFFFVVHHEIKLDSMLYHCLQIYYFYELKYTLGQHLGVGLSAILEDCCQNNFLYKFS